MTTLPIRTVQHSMTRLSISTGIPFDEFCTAFEQAAPPFDPAPFLQIAETGGTWEQIEDATAKLAPNDLLIYARLDARPIIGLAGIPEQAIEYLVGNHVIAASMARHDIEALLYAPLRVLVSSDDHGNAIFAIDRPATVFEGMDNTSIAATGLLLDQKVIGVLRAVGVDATRAFG